VKETPKAAYAAPPEGAGKAPATDLSFWNEVVSEAKRVKPIIGNVLSEVIPRTVPIPS